MMAIKPILFNTEMVMAILEGRKAETRRIVKRTPIYVEIMHDAKRWYYEDGTRNGHTLIPQYVPGDILYVRETYVENKNPHSKNFGRYEYRADYGGAMCQDLIRWHPSIHMPKDAARIFLRVKDVRVERLQDISYEDCKAEGIYDDYKTGDETYTEILRRRAYPTVFRELWEETIKKADLPRYGWGANPWVWVIEFERCEKPEGWCES